MIQQAGRLSTAGLGQYGVLLVPTNGQKVFYQPVTVLIPPEDLKSIRYLALERDTKAGVLMRDWVLAGLRQETEAEAKGGA